MYLYSIFSVGCVCVAVLAYLNLFVPLYTIFCIFLVESTSAAEYAFFSFGVYTLSIYIFVQPCIFLSQTMYAAQNVGYTYMLGVSQRIFFTILFVVPLFFDFFCVVARLYVLPVLHTSLVDYFLHIAPAHPTSVVNFFYTRCSRIVLVEFFTLQERLFSYSTETTLAVFRMYNPTFFFGRYICLYFFIPEEFIFFLQKIQCFCFDIVSMARIELVDLPVLFCFSTLPTVCTVTFFYYYLVLSQ